MMKIIIVLAMSVFINICLRRWMHITQHWLPPPDSRKPTEKELQKIRFLFETTQYEVREKSGTEEELNAAYAQIEGLNAVQEFQIHDSKPIYFSQDDSTAILKLQFEDIVVTLQFWDLYDIQISCDPLANWITEFYCYPSPYDPSRMIFDVGYYQILCKKKYRSQMSAVQHDQNLSYHSGG